MTILALEIGSGGFAAGRVDETVGADEVRRVVVPARKVWNGCRELLLSAAAGGEVTAVGIASAGPVDMTAGVIAPAEIAEWRAGFGIVEAVRKVFPAATVRLALDGVCLALAERNFGATHDVMDSLAMAVSQRICGGFVVGGFAVVGRTGNAGHIGHVLVPGFDEPCDCGGHGCLEATASGAAVLRRARTRGWSGTDLGELVEAARAGDDAPTAAVGRAGTALGRAIASVASLLDIDRVVVGGTLTRAGAALWQPLGEAVADHARLSYLPGLRVIPSELGEVGVLAGAGVLALAAQG